MRTQTTRTIAGRVNADGSVANGPGFAVQKTATGAYTVTLVSAGTLSAVTVSSASITNVYIVSTLNHTGRSFGVLVSSTASTAVDAAFGFTATVTT